MNSLPFKYNGGSEKFNADLEKALNISEKSLEKYLQDSQSPDISRQGIIHTLYLDLGIYYSWNGDRDTARSFFAHAAEYALDITNFYLSEKTLSPRAIPDAARIARDGAIAAQLAGSSLPVSQLFNSAQFLAAGMLSDVQESPFDLTAGLDTMAVYPLIRCYSLVRLGHLNRIYIHKFTHPPQEGKRIVLVWGPPSWGPVVWAQGDIDDMLQTAETCYRLGRHWIPEKFASEYGLFDVLRTLIVCLTKSDSSENLAAARRALNDYLKMIRYFSDFKLIYLLVLDLQAAYPHIYVAD
jgi:tetratricopeptide (TPR) repeat protein